MQIKLKNMEKYYYQKKNTTTIELHKIIINRLDIFHLKIVIEKNHPEGHCERLYAMYKLPRQFSKNYSYL